MNTRYYKVIDVPDCIYSICLIKRSGWPQYLVWSFNINDGMGVPEMCRILADDINDFSVTPMKMFGYYFYVERDMHAYIPDWESRLEQKHFQ